MKNSGSDATCACWKATDDIYIYTYIYIHIYIYIEREQVRERLWTTTVGSLALYFNETRVWRKSTGRRQHSSEGRRLNHSQWSKTSEMRYLRVRLKITVNIWERLRFSLQSTQTTALLTKMKSWHEVFLSRPIVAPPGCTRQTWANNLEPTWKCLTT